MKNTTDSSRIVIALTDGLDNDSNISYKDAAKNASDNKVVVYTIGVDSNVNSSILTEIANLTGGQYYPVSDFNGLSAVFERVIENADLYKDSDDDGISDYHEKCIVNGKLKLGTGATVPNLSSLSYLNEDSDSDELLDGEEIEIKARTVNGKTVYYCYMYSNPCLADTDSDELNDYVENYAGLDPLIAGAAGVTGNGSLPTNLFYEWLWEAAKEIGNDCAEFGQYILDAFADAGDWVVDHIEEIVATGLAIGGILGILYIIANLAPFWVFAI